MACDTINHMSEEINKRKDTQIFLDALKAVKEYVDSSSPNRIPANEYQLLASVHLRTIMEALNDADLPEREYVDLARFAANGWQSDTIGHALTRTAAEFSFLRQRTGISQQRLADDLGVSISTIRRWEDPKNEYTPGMSAWERLDTLEQWERDTARQALEKRIPEMNREIDGLCEILYGFNEGSHFPLNLPGIVVLHYFRDEASYRQAVDMVNHPPTVPVDEDGYPEEPPELYDPDYTEHEYELWSVFADAGSYTIHNAITDRLYEMVKTGDYDHSLTSLQLRVVFTDNVDNVPDVDLTGLLREAMRKIPVSEMKEETHVVE